MIKQYAISRYSLLDALIWDYKSRRCGINVAGLLWPDH